MKTVILGTVSRILNKIYEKTHVNTIQSSGKQTTTEVVVTGLG